MVDDDQIAFGRILQWRLWLVNDSVSGSICIGGIVTKLVTFYGIQLDSLKCIPPVLFEDTFVNKKVVREMMLWMLF